MKRFNVTVAKLGFNGLYLTGAWRAMAPFTRGRGAVLMFHHVRPPRRTGFAPNANLEITPEFLRQVVLRVRRRGYAIVDLDEALRRLAGPEGGRFCALTFDDGYRDNFEHAYPILKELGCPFTVFVATGLIDRTADLWWTVVERIVAAEDEVVVDGSGSARRFPCRTMAEKRATYERLTDVLIAADEDRQRYLVRELAARYGLDRVALLDELMMTWPELQALAADPLVTIGAHTVGHYAVAKLSPARARAEIRDGADVLAAALGTAPRHFAYPYGSPEAAGERDFRILAQLGFTTAVTTRPGVLTSDHLAAPTAWPRVSINGRYQSLHYVDMLLSGAPFALYRGLIRVKARARRVTAVTAAAPRS